MEALKKEKLEDEYRYGDYKHWDDSEDWEIIDGRAYNMAPSPVRKHQKIASKIHGKFFQYLEEKTCEVYFEWDVVLSEENIVKPDIFVVCDKNKLTEKNLQGAPDLVVEILSPSTAKRDKEDKYELYKKYGVREYWIVDPYNLEIDVHNFENNKIRSYFYEEEKEEHFLEVGIFEGDLKLDVNYLFEE